MGSGAQAGRRAAVLVCRQPLSHLLEDGVPQLQEEKHLPVDSLHQCLRPLHFLDLKNGGIILKSFLTG